MKKNLFYLFALICSMSLFTACSDDDDAPDYSKVIESEIAGNYKGSLTVTVEGTPMPSEPQKIKIEKASPSAINLSLADFSFMGIAIGDVELKNCALSQNGDTYTFTGTQELKVDALSCTINAKGTVTNGAVKVDMDIDATVGGLKQSVKVVYEGTRLTGSESSEAKIKTFSFDMSNEANAIVIEQPVINDDNTITFRVDEAAVEADANVLKTLVPIFTISDKATASVESGKAMNLSQDVTITVTAEDGTIAEYIVKAPTKNSFEKFTFDEEWQSVSDDPNNPDETWLSPNPVRVWASANQGVQALKSMMNYQGDFAMLKETPGYNGSVNAVKLQTIKSKGLNAFGIVNAPAITPGTLFTGSFVYSYEAGLTKESQLGMTHFGQKYAKKPLIFRGAYKYKKGTNYIDGSKATGMVTSWNPNEWPENLPNEDKGLIIAVLFEIENADDHLDGNNLMDESKHVMRAVVGGSDYISDTNGEWKTFEVPFEEVSAYAPAKHEQYKLAIVCQSSKDGADFMGAENSTLIVDEFEIIGE